MRSQLSVTFAAAVTCLLLFELLGRSRLLNYRLGVMKTTEIDCQLSIS
jgi:hypothetical protein